MPARHGSEVQEGQTGASSNQGINQTYPAEMEGEEKVEDGRKSDQNECRKRQKPTSKDGAKNWPRVKLMNIPTQNHTIKHIFEQS